MTGSVLVQYRLEPIDAHSSEVRAAYVVLDDPARRNAISHAMLAQLTALLQQAAADTHVRVIVLTSSDEKVFSSGGNVDAFADSTPPITKYADLSPFTALFRTMLGIGKPIVCAANGDVLAGALGIALACDMVIAKSSARLGCPEIRIGAFPFMISALIARATGRLIANELMMTGRLLSATEAASYGLVNRVVPDADFPDAVHDLVVSLAQKSPLLLGLGKQALNATRDLPIEAALEYLRGQLALAFTTEDLAEGVRAFKEKRTPQWRNC
jgi:enoyl-CoA hydratase